jgi:SAM-dependent methyltransferase
MDRKTLEAYDGAAAQFAEDWNGQPPPTDLHDLIRHYFNDGDTADIGCGSGREVAWLVAHEYPAIGYDASSALIAEARRRHPACDFRIAALPELDGLAVSSFANVLCETVIMHLPHDEIARSVRRLVEIAKGGGVIYLSWRVSKDGDQRDKSGRLYAAFDASLVRQAFSHAEILFDEEAVSTSSGKIIHRIIARKS